MKRSEINNLMQEAIVFLNENKFFLPKFAYWSKSDWKNKLNRINEIINSRLGWDITDYGSGNFYKCGLIHFTIRNGSFRTGRNYCEKIMIIFEGQILPAHYHFNKHEDIINRGGGILEVQVYNKTSDNKFKQSPVSVILDGEKITVAAGEILTLTPGESIYLPAGLFHQFWAKKYTGNVLVGEVSSINDDKSDNFYVGIVNRFMNIEEDEEPLYLLCSDFEKYLKK